ncbi:MAG: polyketide cyclase [Rhizobium sp.]|nr:polyketide cyclase [Rhizobium sp.]
MLTVLLYIVVILLAVALVVVTFASTRPNDFSVKRSAEIKAPADTVFALINDFRQWPKWSPWEKLDPNLKRSLSGTEAGRGSVYEWEGDKKVGAGRMEILDSVPPSRVDIKLSFLRPFKAENRTIFTITPVGGASQVLWEMTGTSNLMFKIMGMFMSMDKMVGNDFEKGLAAMKAEAERGLLPES